MRRYFMPDRIVHLHDTSDNSDVDRDEYPG